jgi:hypothetical protein
MAARVNESVAGYIGLGMVERTMIMFGEWESAPLTDPGQLCSRQQLRFSAGLMVSPGRRNLNE